MLIVLVVAASLLFTSELKRLVPGPNPGVSKAVIIHHPSSHPVKRGNRQIICTIHIMVQCIYHLWRFVVTERLKARGCPVDALQVFSFHTVRNLGCEFNVTLYMVNGRINWRVEIWRLETWRVEIWRVEIWRFKDIINQFFPTRKKWYLFPKSKLTPILAIRISKATTLFSLVKKSST